MHAAGRAWRTDRIASDGVGYQLRKCISLVIANRVQCHAGLGTKQCAHGMLLRNRRSSFAVRRNLPRGELLRCSSSFFRFLAQAREYHLSDILSLGPRVLGEAVSSV
jgi:hypothetical protein